MYREILALFMASSLGLIAVSLQAGTIFPGSRSTGQTNAIRNHTYHLATGWTYNMSTTTRHRVSIPITRNSRGSSSVTVVVKVQDNNSASNFRCKLLNPNPYHTSYYDSGYGYSSGTGDQSITLSITGGLHYDGPFSVVCDIPHRENGISSYLKLISVTES